MQLLILYSMHCIVEIVIVNVLMVGLLKFSIWYWLLCLLPFDRYAMKCLDKKRIKMKGGETLALNERIMLSLVSTGVSL